MNDSIFAELQQEAWAMEPRALEAFFRQVAEYAGLATVAARKVDETRPAMRIADRSLVLAAFWD